MSNNRLLLFIGRLPEWEVAENVLEAEGAKYVLSDDVLWLAYVKAHSAYLKAFGDIRACAKREPATAEELSTYPKAPYQ